MMHIGSLPERSESAQILLQSVDGAEDCVRWALNDFTEVNGHLRTKFAASTSLLGSLKHFFNTVFVETPARGAGFKLYVPCTTLGGRIFDVFTIIAFLDAHTEVQHKLLGSGKNSLGYLTQARQIVLKESQEECDEAWDFLDRELVQTDDVINVRSKQLASMLLRNESHEIEDFLNIGLIKQEESEMMMQSVQKDSRLLAVSKREIMEYQAVWL